MRWATPEEAGLDEALARAVARRVRAVVARGRVLGAAAALAKDDAVVGVWTEGERTPGMPVTVATRFALPADLVPLVRRAVPGWDPHGRPVPEVTREAEAQGPVAGVMELIRAGVELAAGAAAAVPEAVRGRVPFAGTSLTASTLLVDIQARVALAVLVTGARPAPGPATARVTVRVSPVPFGAERAFEVEVPHGTTLLRAAAAARAPVRFACARGDCGKCRVDVVQGAKNLEPPTRQERLILGERGLSAGARLGCQARVAGLMSFRQGT